MVNKQWREVKSSAKAGLKRALKVKNLQANLKDAGDLLAKGKVGKAASRAARGIAQDFLDDGQGERGGRGFQSLTKKAMSKYGSQLYESGVYEGKRQLANAVGKYKGPRAKAAFEKGMRLGEMAVNEAFNKPASRSSQLKPLPKPAKYSQLKLL